MFGIRLHVYWILGEDVFSSILRVFTGILRVVMKIYEYFKSISDPNVHSSNRVLG